MPRITITEAEKTPQPYRLKLDREETSIGRGPDNAVILETPSASTHHCIMRRVSGGFILQDLNSTNGITFEDTRFEVIDLVNDMIIYMGENVELHYSLDEEEIEALQAEEFQSYQKIMLPQGQTGALPPVEEEFNEIPTKKEPQDLDENYPAEIQKQPVAEAQPEYFTESARLEEESKSNLLLA